MDDIPESVELPPDPSSARAARAFVLDALGLREAETLELVVSELTSNAVRHAQTPFIVTVSKQDRVVRVEVHDRRPERPVVPRQPSPSDLGGRGLLIVDNLADRWGVSQQENGKTVWVELQVPR